MFRSVQHHHQPTPLSVFTQIFTTRKGARPSHHRATGKRFFPNKVRKQCTISIKSRPRMGSSRRTDSLTLNLMIQSLSSNSNKIFFGEISENFISKWWRYFYHEIFRIVRGWVFPQNRILKFGSTPKFGWERGQFFNTPPLRAHGGRIVGLLYRSASFC